MFRPAFCWKPHRKIPIRLEVIVISYLSIPFFLGEQPSLNYHWFKSIMQHSMSEAVYFKFKNTSSYIFFNVLYCFHIIHCLYWWFFTISRGARWLSGRVSDSGARGRGFETCRRRVVSLSKTLYSPKVLVNYPGRGGSVPTWLKNCWLGR